MRGHCIAVAVAVAAALCFASLSLPGLFLFRSLRYADSIRRRVVR